MFVGRRCPCLEDFQFLSKKSFSSTLNIGLYFQEPTTLNITLEGNPQEIHDGNLPYFTRTFGGDEAFLGELFGNFMLQITRGEHTQVLETFIQAKAAEGAIALCSGSSGGGSSIHNKQHLNCFHS